MSTSSSLNPSDKRMWDFSVAKYTWNLKFNFLFPVDYDSFDPHEFITRASIWLISAYNLRGKQN